MSWFSERSGFRKIETEIQLESMDNTLRNQLWNMLDTYYWEKMHGFNCTRDNDAIFKMLVSIWHYYYKEPVDMLPKSWRDCLHLVRARFFESQWYCVYDLLEATARFSDESTDFQNACNQVLEKEVSAYRFVSGRIVRITAPEEISAIEEAINSPIAVVNTHLENALGLFSDRQSPDYRNSIKESISAVEALCKLITQNPNATLGDALNTIERQTGGTIFHPALAGAFHKLYGYTNDADGIRHGFKDDKVNSGYEEAKFMLVACSAFANYLISKASKSGIKL